MTVEAEITRRLGIRFIDARTLASEAKLSTGVSGYATKDQVPFLVARAVEIFEAKSDYEKEEMRKLNDDLESVKASHHSRSKRMDGDDGSSIHTVDSTASFTSMRSESGFFRKVVSMGAMRRKNSLADKGPMKNATFGTAAKVVPTKNASFGAAGSPIQENPLLKKVSSMGGLPPARSTMRRNNSPRTVIIEDKTGDLSSADKRNRISRVDRLGAILDIQVPHVPKQGLECITSGRDWDESL